MKVKTVLIKLYNRLMKIDAKLLVFAECCHSNHNIFLVLYIVQIPGEGNNFKVTSLGSGSVCIVELLSRIDYEFYILTVFQAFIGLNYHFIL